MSLGSCPECSHQVASSADECPNCGNTDFWVKVGSPYYDRCYWCSGEGKHYAERKSWTKCYSCNGTGRAKYHLCRDPRNGEEQGFMYDTDGRLAKGTYVGQSHRN